MKKYLLLLSCSLFASGTALALSADDQLKVVKDLYLKEFERIDTNKDGQISQQEYINHQFNALRENIISADGFDATDTSAEPAISNTSAHTTTKSATEQEPVGVPAALQDMANYELEEDVYGEEPIRLTKEDVMPQDGAETAVEELDLSISEEESLKQLIANVDNSQTAAEPVAEDVPLLKEDQINFMLETIKKTLPKKIDEITTWVDITYQDSVIDYVYQANIDTATYGEDEMKALQDSIQKEACTKAYTDMCPRIKPMFIDEGIDMRIVYLDKNKENISACLFNKTTCK